MSMRTQTAKATRLLLINGWGPIQLPWFILGLSFTVNLAIFAAGQNATDPASRITGGLSSIYVMAIVANQQTWTQTFPFAMGLSITRRAFFAGSGIVVLAQSVVAGLGLLALKGLEIVTGGWGLSLQFFALPYVSQDNLLAQFLVYAVPYLMLATLGSVIGVVFTRWGQLGVYTMLGGSILLGGAAVFLVIWRGWQGGTSDFFTGTDPILMMAGYPALLAAAFAGVAFVVVRRATP